MGDKSHILDSKDSQSEFSEFDRKRIESVGEDTEYGDETQSLLAMEERSSYSQIPFGFQSRGSYKHASKNCEIVGGTTNSLMFSDFNDKFASPPRGGGGTLGICGWGCAAGTLGPWNP